MVLVVIRVLIRVCLTVCVRAVLIRDIGFGTRNVCLYSVRVLLEPISVTIIHSLKVISPFRGVLLGRGGHISEHSYTRTVKISRSLIRHSLIFGRLLCRLGLKTN